jgi:hypothetical protein
MRRTLLLFILLLLSSSKIFAQTAEDTVKATISSLFAAMRNSDPFTLSGFFADSAIIQTIAKDKNANTVIKTDKVNGFAMLVGQMPKNSADERVIFDIVRIDGPLATVWAPYKFYWNNLLHHCGVNSFQLIRAGRAWKIQYMIDTRRIYGCQ